MIYLTTQESKEHSNHLVLLFDHPGWHFFGTGGSQIPLLPPFLGGGFGLGLGFGWGFGLGAGLGAGFGGKHPPGLVDGPGLHIQGLCCPGGHGFPLGQPFGGPCGFPAIIAINKIIGTIFRIMSTYYV